MLSQIQIRNFTIVDQLELDLNRGMTVLTGETGAGKSILLDALNLALGGRADTGMIRHGCERAEIFVSLDISGHEDIQQWLNDNELDDGLDCVIRRTVNADGRSKGYINGYPVPMQSLKQLGDMLVDIHGQHAHQSLLKKDKQRQTLDDFAGHNALVVEVQRLYNQWKALTKQQAELEKSRDERNARIELLTYQTEELDQLNLQENEIEAIELEHSRLANLNLIREGVEKVLYTLNDAEQDSISSVLSRSTNEVENLQSYDPALDSSAKMLSDASIQLTEAIDELKHYANTLTLDPQRLAQLDERLGLIHDLSRKHRVNAQQLVDLTLRLKEELVQLQKMQQQTDSLDAQIEQSARTYAEYAKKLSANRGRYAAQLQKRVSENMQLLGMQHGQFQVDLQANDEFSPGGMERVEFLVNTNPGQNFKPMNKVASGGELSRISLALQVIIADKGRIPTLIFDEVDVGIGGGIAEIVGRLLRKLSVNRQVLCITHQPQVAALGHQHLFVSKSSDKNSTHSSVIALDGKQRIQEIARMLGGLEITEQTLKHAKEMINSGQSEESLK